MYKVFISDKLVILSGTPVIDHIYNDIKQIPAYSKKEIKEIYFNFINNSRDKKLILYNNSDAKRLLEDFISLFWYVEAAGGLVINSKSEQLFIHRFGRWDLPKGKIEKNETVEQAAIREVQEETGLMEVSILKILPSTFHIFDYKGKKVLKRTYWFMMKYTGNSEPKPQTEEEIIEARWFSPDDLAQVMDNTYSSLKLFLQEI